MSPQLLAIIKKSVAIHSILTQPLRIQNYILNAMSMRCNKERTNLKILKWLRLIEYSSSSFIPLYNSFTSLDAYFDRKSNRSSDSVLLWLVALVAGAGVNNASMELVLPNGSSTTAPCPDAVG